MSFSGIDKALESFLDSTCTMISPANIDESATPSKAVKSTVGLDVSASLPITLSTKPRVQKKILDIQKISAIPLDLRGAGVLIPLTICDSEAEQRGGLGLQQ